MKIKYRKTLLYIPLIVMSLVATALVIGQILIPLLLWSFDDAPKEPIVDKIYIVKQYKINERIYQRSSWPDHIYKRNYTLENGWWPIELGSFRNEDRIGVEAATPKIVGAWLLVFSANRIFLWKPQHNLIEFEPYQASGWSEYAGGVNGINGHYDYQSVDFLIQGDRWILEYRCRQNCAGNLNNQPKPAKINFFSTDQGKTFHISKTQNIVTKP